MTLGPYIAIAFVAIVVVLIISAAFFVDELDRRVAQNTYRKKWIQPKMMLSMWVDPKGNTEADYKKRYEEIVFANFTAIMGGFGATSEKQIVQQLNAAFDLDLGVIVASDLAGFNDYSDKNIYSQIRNASSFWGFLVKDEPFPSDFPTYANLSKELAQKFPTKLQFINLFPPFNGRQWFIDYVRTFVEEIEPDVLCFDHYPSFESGWDAADYKFTLAVVRANAMAVGIPFWNFYGAIRVYNEDPTEAQIRWQMFTSLAFGAKGLLAFAYYGAHPTFNFMVRAKKVYQGALAPLGPAEKMIFTEHYYQVKRINTHILAYKEVLFPAVTIGVYEYTPSGVNYKQSDATQKFGPPSSNAFLAWVWSVDGMGPPQPLLAGQFRLCVNANNGNNANTINIKCKKALLLCNQGTAFNAVIKVNFTDDLLRELPFICEISSVSGQEEPVLNDGDGPFLQLVLEAGSARLFTFTEFACGQVDRYLRGRK
jgi:hypothetical protein